jgi:hypothetical protein
MLHILTFFELLHACLLTTITVICMQCDQGKFEEAAPVYARVLGIARRTLPQLHPRIAAATNNFGLVLKQVSRRVTLHCHDDNM